MADRDIFGIPGVLGMCRALTLAGPFNAWFGVLPEITPELRQATAATF